jgi:hypothetical protein
MLAYPGGGRARCVGRGAMRLDNLLPGDGRGVGGDLASLPLPRSRSSNHFSTETSR